jgi:hypothetical protein
MKAQENPNSAKLRNRENEIINPIQKLFYFIPHFNHSRKEMNHDR